MAPPTPAPVGQVDNDRLYGLLEQFVENGHAHQKDLVEAIRANTTALQLHENGANARHGRLVEMFGKLLAGGEPEPPTGPIKRTPPARPPWVVQVINATTKATAPAIKAVWDVARSPIAMIGAGAAGWACAYYFGSGGAPQGTIATGPAPSNAPPDTTHLVVAPK